jgi:transcriptional regulator with XRE-family HTH domain
MSQDQLAVRSGIDSSNIRSYESGRATMNLRSLARIAEALKVQPGTLMQGVTSRMFDEPSGGN